MGGTTPPGMGGSRRASPPAVTARTWTDRARPSGASRTSRRPLGAGDDGIQKRRVRKSADEKQVNPQQDAQKDPSATRGVAGYEGSHVERWREQPRVIGDADKPGCSRPMGQRFVLAAIAKKQDPDKDECKPDHGAATRQGEPPAFFCAAIVQSLLSPARHRVNWAALRPPNTEGAAEPPTRGEARPQPEGPSTRGPEGDLAPWRKNPSSRSDGRKPRHACDCVEGMLRLTFAKSARCCIPCFFWSCLFPAWASCA